MCCFLSFTFHLSLNNGSKYSYFEIHHIFRKHTSNCIRSCTVVTICWSMCIAAVPILSWKDSYIFLIYMSFIFSKHVNNAMRLYKKIISSIPCRGTPSMDLVGSCVPYTLCLILTLAVLLFFSFFTCFFFYQVNVDWGIGYVIFSSEWFYCCYVKK